jgi:S-adenosylmethionine hydrolase
MAIYLFTDFGTADLYVGQLKAVLQEHAPQFAVIDLMHEAPAFNIEASAHLLAALAPRIPRASVVVAVVDPGVGSERAAVAVRANESWFIGPDNGLLSVWTARCMHAEYFRIEWRPQQLSASFHGRDLFAPVAARLACGEPPVQFGEQVERLAVEFASGDLSSVIYIDHYGNAVTGVRALNPSSRLAVNGRPLPYARVFSDVPHAALFWYVNSLGLLEIAGNGISAAAELSISVGQQVSVEA